MVRHVVVWIPVFFVGLDVVDLGADLVLQLASPLEDFLDVIVLFQAEVIDNFQLPRLERFR